MSRRRRGEASSLELLLDTMCNTFGGVMFIAISLFVVISAMEPERPEPEPEQETVSPEELKSEIARLEETLRRKALRLESFRREVALRQDQALDRRVREIAMAEEELKVKTLDLNLREAAVRTLELEKEKRTAELPPLRAEIVRQESAAAKVRRQRLELESELLRIAARPVMRRKLTFHVLQPDTRKPFFLLMRGDRVWPVGPWRRDGSDVPDEAVTSREIALGQQRNVICTPKEGAGLPVLAGSGLAPEFRQLLSRIPADRVPKFSVPASSAATAFRMRELLKQARTPHGWSPHPEEERDFTYFYTDHVNYEY